MREADEMISEADARRIASEWHGGQWSAFYAFSSSGAIIEGVLEELEEMRQAKTIESDHEHDQLATFIESRITRGAWVAGYNMPGYLPEMEPYAAPTFDDAKAFIVEEMERSADHHCDWVYGSPEHADGSYLHNPEMMQSLEIADEISAAQQDLNLASPSDWGQTIGNTAWWITYDADAVIYPDGR